MVSCKVLLQRIVFVCDVASAMQEKVRRSLVREGHSEGPRLWLVHSMRREARKWQDLTGETCERLWLVRAGRCG